MGRKSEEEDLTGGSSAGFWSERKIDEVNRVPSGDGCQEAHLSDVLLHIDDTRLPRDHVHKWWGPEQRPEIKIVAEILFDQRLSHRPQKTPPARQGPLRSGV
jgi:hypothetical protein